MKKSEKIKINNLVEKKWNEAKKELDFNNNNLKCLGKLRSCSATVFETSKYYFLNSYNTFVAFIDKENDTCYDVLRLVYGYTSTSAQHISKFKQDYGIGYYGCSNELRWNVI